MNTWFNFQQKKLALFLISAVLKIKPVFKSSYPKRSALFTWFGGFHRSLFEIRLKEANFSKDSNLKRKVMLHILWPFGVW